MPNTSPQDKISSLLTKTKKSRMPKSPSSSSAEVPAAVALPQSNSAPESKLPTSHAFKSKTRSLSSLTLSANSQTNSQC